MKKQTYDMKKKIQKLIKLVRIGFIKATSYKVVKGRLNYRFYSDDLLEQRFN